jgi:uncharacterized protein (TIGR03086 family)
VNETVAWAQTSQTSGSYDEQVSETAERYQRVAAGFSARLTNVAGAQWSAVTPCADWTARDLAAHVIGTQRRVITRLSDASVDEVQSDGDLPAQWNEASREITDALLDPSRAAVIVGGMFGEQSFESLVGRMVCTDILVHTWDLARATGQDEHLDPKAVSMAAEFLLSIDDAIRAPGGFGEKLTPSSDADDQTRFLNFCGRAV